MIEGKALDTWGLSDIKTIFESKLLETTTLEYKKEFPPSDGEKNKLERSVCAFANTRGGHIIIGIDSDKVTLAPIAMDGIKDEPGLVERITSFCQRPTP